MARDIPATESAAEQMHCWGLHGHGALSLDSKIILRAIVWLLCSLRDNLGEIAIPDALVRAFDRHHYAAQFIQGTLRLGRLDSYRRLPDCRRDETEGRVSLQWNLANPVYCDRLCGNEHYLLCTSHPDVDRQVITKFGRHIVRIADPKLLLTRIDSAWRQHPLASGRCIIAPVVYNKDQCLQPTPGLLPPTEYSYCQKPATFSDEREFRYVLTCTADAAKLRAFGEIPPHVELRLPDCSDICSLMGA
jgi:hypothetical protein